MPVPARDSSGTQQRFPPGIISRGHQSSRGVMPFQIRVESLIVIAPSEPEAVRLFDALATDGRNGVLPEVRDMDGMPVGIGAASGTRGFHKSPGTAAQH
jgi:hypothetical protein